MIYQPWRSHHPKWWHIKFIPNKKPRFLGDRGILLCPSRVTSLAQAGVIRLHHLGWRIQYTSLKGPRIYAPPTADTADWAIPMSKAFFESPLVGRKPLELKGLGGSKQGGLGENRCKLVDDVEPKSNSQMAFLKPAESCVNDTQIPLFAPGSLANQTLPRTLPTTPVCFGMFRPDLSTESLIHPYSSPSVGRLLKEHHHHIFFPLVTPKSLDLFVCSLTILTSQIGQTQNWSPPKIIWKHLHLPNVGPRWEPPETLQTGLHEVLVRTLDGELSSFDCRW